MGRYASAAALVLPLTVATAAAQGIDEQGAAGEKADPWRDVDCDFFKKAPIPKKDVPSPAEEKALQGCDSGALYYGIGVPSDPVLARKCAYLRLQQFPQGAEVLMMVYANGRGVKRNPLLAARFACESFVDAAWMEGLLNDIRAGKKGSGAKQIDYYDYLCNLASTTMEMNTCEAHRQEIEWIGWSRRRETAVVNMPRELLAKVEDAYRAYVDNLINNEIEQSGSIHGVERISTAWDLRQKLVAQLEVLHQRGHPPEGNDLKGADDELNRVYKRLMSRPSTADSSINAQGIRVTQRAWLQYRDAWVELVKASNPEGVDAWRASLTRARTKMLQSLENPDGP